VYRPFAKASEQQEVLKGQEMLRDIYKAFVGSGQG
jgi:hypothetical protein